MSLQPNVALAASLIADPARAAMMAALREVEHSPMPAANKGLGCDLTQPRPMRSRRDPS
jgi:hypothetical protein